MTEDEKKILKRTVDALDGALLSLLEAAGGEWDLSRRFDQALDQVEKEIWHAKALLDLVIMNGKK